MLLFKEEETRGRAFVSTLYHFFAKRKAEEISRCAALLIFHSFWGEESRLSNSTENDLMNPTGNAKRE